MPSKSWGEVGPESLERGIGGREGALLYLSKEWAKNGVDVTNFVNTPKSSRYYENDNFHEYVPIEVSISTISNFPYDAVIAWECPSIFHDLKDVESTKITYLQCSALPNDYELECANIYSDYLGALSQWHSDYLAHTGFGLPPERVVVLPNGVDLSRYPRQEKVLTRPWRFVYSSSPDRGLWYLLQAWPAIRALEPRAELVVTYGVKNWTSQVKWHHSRQGEMAVEIEKLMSQDGIVDFGKVGQGQLAKLQMSATAWLYPLDASFPTETGCITEIENMAAGNPCITTDGDCLEDEFGDYSYIVPLPYNSDMFVESVKMVLTDEDIYVDLQEKGYEFSANRDWGLVSKKWLDLFQSKK